jgi:chromosome segregation protein
MAVNCAVEDTALADLLCRRLLSTSDQMDWRYNIDIGPEGAAAIVIKMEILSLPVGVLRHGSGLQGVG